MYKLFTPKKFQEEIQKGRTIHERVVLRRLQILRENAHENNMRPAHEVPIQYINLTPGE